MTTPAAWVWLCTNAVSALLLACLAALVCARFKDRPTLGHQAWTLVLVSLIVPPMPLPDFGAATLRARLVDAVRTSTPRGQVPVEGAPGQRVFPIAARPAEEIAPRTSASIEPPMAAAPTPARSAATPAAPPADPVPWWTVAALVWSVGAAWMLLQALRRARATRAVLRRGRRAPATLVDEVARVARAMSMRTPSVLVVDGLAGPAVSTLGFPRLLWPSDWIDRGESSLIAHELAHIRRLDPWVGHVEMIAGVVCWWNPVYWLARRRVRELAELSCDAWAMTLYPARRRRYAEALLGSLERMLAERPATPVGLGALSHDRRALERRLRMVMGTSTTRRGSLAAAAGLLLCAGFTAPTWSEVLGDDPYQSARERAEALFQQGRYEEAAAAFRSLLASTPAPQPAVARAPHATSTLPRPPAVARAPRVSATPPPPPVVARAPRAIANLPEPPAPPDPFAGQGSTDTAPEPPRPPDPFTATAPVAPPAAPTPPTAPHARPAAVRSIAGAEPEPSPFTRPRSAARSVQGEVAGARSRYATTAECEPAPGYAVAGEVATAEREPAPGYAVAGGRARYATASETEPAGGIAVVAGRRTAAADTVPETTASFAAPPAQATSRYVRGGDTHSEQGEYAAAIELYRQAHELRPDDPAVALRLARALMRLGRIDEALEVLDRIDLRSTSPSGAQSR